MAIHLLSPMARNTSLRGGPLLLPPPRCKAVHSNRFGYFGPASSSAFSCSCSSSSPSAFVWNARIARPRTGKQLSAMGPPLAALPQVHEEAAVAGSEAKTAEGKFLKIDLRSYKLSDLNAAELKALQARPRIDFSAIFDTVGPIVNKVRTNGDEAVKEYTSRFDKVYFEKIVENVADLPDPQLDPEVKAAFDVAYNNIRTFHAAQQKTHTLEVETMPVGAVLPHLSLSRML